MKHENHSVTCIENSWTTWQSQVELRTLHCRHKVGTFGWRVPWPPASCVSWIIICRNSESRQSFALIVHLNVWSVMSSMFSWGHLQRMLTIEKWSVWDIWAILGYRRPRSQSWFDFGFQDVQIWGWGVCTQRNPTFRSSYKPSRSDASKVAWWSWCLFHYFPWLCHVLDSFNGRNRKFVWLWLIRLWFQCWSTSCHPVSANLHKALESGVDLRHRWCFGLVKHTWNFCQCLSWNLKKFQVPHTNH